MELRNLTLFKRKIIFFRGRLRHLRFHRSLCDTQCRTFKMRCRWYDGFSKMGSKQCSCFHFTCNVQAWVRCKIISYYRVVKKLSRYHFCEACNIYKALQIPSNHIFLKFHAFFFQGELILIKKEKSYCYELRSTTVRSLLLYWKAHQLQAYCFFQCLQLLPTLIIGSWISVTGIHAMPYKPSVFCQDCIFQFWLEH